MAVAAFVQARLGSAYPWFVVVILIVLYTVNFIDRTIFSLLVKPIRADFQISDTQYSLLAGFAFAVMYTFSGIPMGWIADHLNRRNVIAWGCFAWSLMTTLCGVANTLPALFAARIGVGIGEASLAPSAYSMMADYFPRDKLARAISLYSMGIPMGSGLALVIGGTVVDALASHGDITLPLIGTPRPWQLVFYVIGIPGILLAAILPFILAEPPRQNALTGEAAEKAIGIRATVRYIWNLKAVYGNIILGTALAAVVGFAANTWLPSYLQRVHEFTAGQAGQLLGFSSLILGVAGAASAGLATDYLLAKGRQDAHLLVGLIWVTGILICAGIGPLVPIPWLSIAMVAGLGFFSFTWTGAPIALLQIITPNRSRGQLNGLNLFTVNLIGLGIGPTAVGASTDYIFGRDEAVGMSLGLVGIIAGVLALLLLNAARRKVLELNLLSRG